MRNVYNDEIHGSEKAGKIYYLVERYLQEISNVIHNKLSSKIFEFYV